MLSVLLPVVLSIIFRDCRRTENHAFESMLCGSLASCRNDQEVKQNEDQSQCKELAYVTKIVR